MTFSVAGIEVSPLIPPLVAFVLAALCAPAGISGAFLLLPFQVSVLGFTNPSVTPTNLLYNIVATPGGVIGYERKGRLDWSLLRLTLAGTVPGVVVGALLRTEWFADPNRFRAFVGLVLVPLGLKLGWDALNRTSVAPRSSAEHDRPALIVALSALVGVIGGVYGIGGGAIIAPFLTAALGLPVERVAGVALAGTFVTSAVGIVAFELLEGAGRSYGPDWQLGLLFGAGGFAGSYVGARLQQRIPPRAIKALLGVLVIAAAVSYLV